MSKQELPVSHIPINQSIIEFLSRCHDATDNSYKRKAYCNAINEIHGYWHAIDNNWKPNKIGQSIERKIREFLDGIPEMDIINS